MSSPDPSLPISLIFLYQTLPTLHFSPLLSVPSHSKREGLELVEPSEGRGLLGGVPLHAPAAYSIQCDTDEEGRNLAGLKFERTGGVKT